MDPVIPPSGDVHKRVPQSSKKILEGNYQSSYRTIILAQKEGRTAMQFASPSRVLNIKNNLKLAYKQYRSATTQLIKHLNQVGSTAQKEEIQATSLVIEKETKATFLQLIQHLREMNEEVNSDLSESQDDLESDYQAISRPLTVTRITNISDTIDPASATGGVLSYVTTPIQLSPSISSEQVVSPFHSIPRRIDPRQGHHPPPGSHTLQDL